jgi:hypothetical protein
MQYDDTQTAYRYLWEILSIKIEDQNWSADWYRDAAGETKVEKDFLQF